MRALVSVGVTALVLGLASSGCGLVKDADPQARGVANRTTTTSIRVAPATTELDPSPEISTAPESIATTTVVGSGETPTLFPGGSSVGATALPPGSLPSIPPAQQDQLCATAAGVMEAGTEMTNLPRPQLAAYTAAVDRVIRAVDAMIPHAPEAVEVDLLVLIDGLTTVRPSLGAAPNGAAAQELVAAALTDRQLVIFDLSAKVAVYCPNLAAVANRG